MVSFDFFAFLGTALFSGKLWQRKDESSALQCVPLWRLILMSRIGEMWLGKNDFSPPSIKILCTSFLFINSTAPLI